MKGGIKVSDFYEYVDDKGNSIEVDIEELVSRLDIVQYVSQYIELEEKKGEFWACCPFHDNDETPSFAINPEKQQWFCQACKKGGNIVGFYIEYHNVKFPEAIVGLCKYAKLDVSELKAPPDTIRILREYSRKRKKKVNIQRKILKDDCMLIYDKAPIKEWLSEGISQSILEKYQVRYNKLDNAIVFPIWDNDGNIINIKKRTLNNNYKALKQPKYINFCKIGELDYLFGFAQNKDTYNSYKTIILFESEKSVMKLESHGYFNSVALSTSTITQKQAITLIQTGKEIVIALDKDVPVTEIRKRFKYLIKFTNTSVIIDSSNMLKPKDSPIDCGFDVFNELYKRRIKL